MNSPAFGAPLSSNLEHRREHLIRLIKSNSQFEQCKVIIVFDNSTFSKASRVSGGGRVQIMFTQPSMEADELIKRLVRNEKNPDRLIVVSSDRAIQYAAKDHGAASLSSEDYCRMFGRRSPASSSKIDPGFDDEKHDPNLGEKEIQYWKRLFGKNTEGE